MNVRPLLLALAWSLAALGVSVDLEALVTSPNGFGMTKASPVQRAACRIMTGVPLGELADNPTVADIVGGPQALAALPTTAPRMCVFGAAVRCGKSTIVAAKALRNAYLSDCSDLPPWEVPRVPIVSVDLDKSRETFSKLTGALLSSSALSSLLVKDPGTDNVLVRNKDGRTVEIKMIANARAGSTLVSRWCVGAIFDEATRMIGEEDGVVNLSEALRAIRARMRPGAQIDLLGSIYAPRGVVYGIWEKRFGKPGDDVVVIVATGPQLRPALYTPEYCEQLRKDDPLAYETDVMSRWAQPEEALLAAVDVSAALRPHDVPPLYNPRQEYVAVMDPATRGNGWSLVVLTRRADGVYEVCVAREWVGTRQEPLKARTVLGEIAQALEQYELAEVHTDQFGFDFLVEIGDLAETGLIFMPATRDDDVSSKKLKALMSERRMSLPDNAQLRSDLIALRRRPRQAGGSQIILPKTNDGRHCDYAAAMLIAVQILPDAPSEREQGPSEDERAVLELLNERADHPMEFAAGRINGIGDWF